MVSVQRHLAVLRDELDVHETERLWVRAERLPQGHVGALMVTDRRLLFSGLGFLQQSQPTWPIEAVRVEARRPREIDLRIRSERERFGGKESDLERLAALIGSDPPDASPDDLVERLERLAALQRSGHLTSEEFDRAKRRLLG